MVRNRAVACAVSATALFAVAAGTSVAKPKTSKKVTCHITLFQQQAPSASGPGVDFGFSNCSGPFGKGVQYDTFTLMPTSPSSGNAVLKFKAYYNNGTVSGVWKAVYQFTSSTTATFTQKKVEWTSGTGAFKHVSASGSGTGLLNGKIGTITQKLSVSKL